MSPLALQNGPPSLDRLALVAALIEYDNDDAPPEKRKDHRQSAIFTQFRPRPLDRLVHDIPDQMSDASRPLPTRSQTYHTEPSNENYQYDALHDPRPQSYVAPRLRDSMTMDILEGRQRFNPNAPRGVDPDGLGRVHEGYQEESREYLEDVDVDRWGLPEHLVAKEEPPTSRPKSSMSTDTQARPTSSVSYAPAIIPPTSEYGRLDPGRPTSVPFPAARTTNINPPDVNRARSIHLDVVGSESTNYEHGADSALEAAERIRQLVEAGSSTMRERTRSAGDTVTRLDRSSRRVSFNELDLIDRPSTSQGLRSIPRSSGKTPPTSPPSMRPRSAMRRQPSNPLLVPLPASPMYAPMASTSSWLPSIVAEEDLEGLDDLPDPVISSEPNPFAMPPPPAVIGSRFDPKQLENQRVASRQSHHTRPSTSMSLQRSSLAQFDNLSRSATPAAPMEFIEEQDIGDLRVYDDIPTAEQYGRPLQPPKYANARPQRLSRMDLLRPKTLFMPPSLANQPEPPSPPKKKWEIPPEGFSIGEKPLPPGARTSVLTLNGIPQIPLSLSQRTFRSSLMVGGERGEEWVGGAEEDGEVGISKKERADLGPEAYERKAGKLYGKSLIDQLEARKAAMKGRQRYFTGDSRPAMMDRSSFPNAVPAGPSTLTSPTNARAPLPQFDDNGELHRSPDTPDMPNSASDHRFSQMAMPTSASSLLPPSRPIDRMTKSNSVFGVDQIWETEMAKLKIRQAHEAEQAQLARYREEEEERRKQEKRGKKKKDRKGKGKARESDFPELHSQDTMPEKGVDGERALMDDFSPINRVPDLPPMLHFSPEKAPAREVAVQEQVADSDSDEDVPLSQLRQTARTRPGSMRPPSTSTTHLADNASDSDSDVPLAQLRKAKSSKSPNIDKPTLTLSTEFAPTLDLGDIPPSATGSLGLNLPAPENSSEMTKPTQEEVGEDDDVPLLLRQAHIKSLAPAVTAVSNDDDDDVPLGVRQSMLLSTNSISGFRPPDPALYAPGYHPGYQSPYQPVQMHPHAHAASMYGYPPAQWGSPMPMQGWPPQFSQQPQQMGYPSPSYPFPPAPPMGMPMNMGHMNFPDLNAMMQAQGQGIPGPPNPEAGLPSENIDSWRKGVDPAVAPPASVGGGSGSRRS